MTYAGDLTPTEAWDLLKNDEGAVLVDVRTEGEWQTVGVPDTTSLDKAPAFIEWVHGDGTLNADFLATLTTAGLAPGDGRPVVFLCRSGQRSVAAANAATAAGFGPAYNVLEGFEGGIDASGQRGSTGWKARGNAWTTQAGSTSTANPA